MDLRKLMGDPEGMRDNLFAYVQAFSPSVRAAFIDLVWVVLFVWCLLSRRSVTA